MKFTDYPSLRLLIPFVGGILLHNAIGDTQISISLLSLLFTLSLFVAMLLLICAKKTVSLYGIALCISFFMLGILLSEYHYCKVRVEWPIERRIYSGLLKDYPIEKEKSYRLDLELIDSVYGGTDVILYVPKDTIVATLSPGMLLSFKGTVSPPSNESIESDFDYVEYLYRKGISGTLWVSSANWKIVPGETQHSLQIAAVKCRKQILDRYKEWGLKDDVLAVVAAVTIGYKDELTDELRSVYSSSGASHVLAVSGLHIGILFAILSFLFPLYMNGIGTRWLKELIVIMLMWCYAFIIGLPYSITRALIMFSILAICRSIGRENSSLNGLAFAALVILVSNPNALFDVGFQLSFLAVLAILLFEPHIRQLYVPKNRVVEYIWSLVTVSIAAQLGTAPLVMLNFENYSTYFLLTNIIVIPLMFVIVFVSLLMLSFSFIPPLRIIFVWILVRLVTITNESLSLIVDLPYSTLTVDNLSPFTVCCIYVSLFLLYLYMVRKKTTYTIYLLVVVAIWSITGLCIQLE